jgi:N-acetylneuraminic acid mutarotase
VTIGDRIILFVRLLFLSSPRVIILYRFGGALGRYFYIDTWLFDVPTRKWSELQCTGFTPSPRQGHAAAVVDDVMYVFGGCGIDGDRLDDLTAFKLSGT